ncbi:MAG: IS66 family insertion sequence element accessory protein TnpB [Desulfobacula sp.]
MFFPTQNLKVFIALGSTDMRKSMDGLSILVSEKFNLDPFSGHLFVFTRYSSF